VNLYGGFAYVMVGRKPEAVPASDPPH